MITKIDIDKSLDISSEEFFTFMIDTLKIEKVVKTIDETTKIETVTTMKMTLSDVEEYIMEKKDYSNFKATKNL